ncbi:hypothetical protein JOM56_000945 [Amanita muscaria]
MTSTHRKIIQMNWLCNLTGKPHAFRAIDWLVERNNLYTKKVIYGGTGSNRTIEHIMQESPLIELYRDCHLTVENGFHLEHCTIRHTHPDVTKTLWKLRTEIMRHTANSFKAGRRSKMCIPDQIAVAMDMMQKKKDVTVNEAEDERAEVDGVDLTDKVFSVARLAPSAMFFPFPLSPFGFQFGHALLDAVEIFREE